ncbi:MAG: hypothetical protein FWG49_07680 [Leptospirales bacterium]|nr:hypothetical protein [Leptospirales bacterium]
MKFKKYLILFVITAALIPISPIKGQVNSEDEQIYSEGEVSEKYMKLSALFSEIDFAFSKGQYNDVITASDKLKDIGFSYNDLEPDEDDAYSDERAIWINIIWFRGLSEYNLGKYKEAGEDLGFVLENVENPAAYVYTCYADSLNRIGDTKGAIAALEKGVKNLEDKISDSDMHDLMWNLGWYYYLDGRYKKTILIGFECSELNSYSTGPVYNASLAMLALKDYNNAMRYFLKAFNSSFQYDDEFKEWILRAVIEDVNNCIKEYGESDILNTMLFLAYKGLEDMASDTYRVYLTDEPLGNYTGLVDEPTPQFLYVIASAYSIKKNILVDKYLIELRAQDQSYIEKSKNDPDFDWYYSSYGDKKFNKPQSAHKDKKINKPKSAHKDKKFKKSKSARKDKKFNKPKSVQKDKKLTKPRS